MSTALAPFRRPGRPGNTGAPPPFWTFWLCTMFRTTPQFAGKLWRHYMPPATVLYQLHLCRHLGQAPTGEAAIARMMHLAALVPPAVLIELSITVSPEGKLRLPEAVRFEAAVLWATDSTGVFR